MLGMNAEGLSYAKHRYSRRVNFSSWLSDVTAGVVSNVLSALVVGLAVSVIWPSRKVISASLRRFAPVRNVGLYLSMDQDRWNLEVPRQNVADVMWRLRAYGLRRTDFITSINADEYTEAFDFRTASWDQSFEEDVKEIQADLKKHRISVHLVGEEPWLRANH